MKYKKGYKYQLYETEVFEDVGIYPDNDILQGTHLDNPYIGLTTKGKLTILNRFPWDGCSGPTIDRKTNMRGGLGHDALSQLFRLKLLDKKWFDELNIFFQRILKEDGMCSLWTEIYKIGVSIDDFYIDPANAKKVYTAP